MIKELKTLWYICNGCEVSVLLREVPAGTLPEGWSYKIEEAPLRFDGYWSRVNDPNSDLVKVSHYCPTCTEKNEIKEVFK